MKTFREATKTITSILGPILFGSVITAIITVYFVQKRENAFKEQSEAAARGYVQRQDVINGLFPIFEEYRRAIAQLADHDSVESLELRDIRSVVATSAKAEEKAIEHLDAAWDLTDIKMKAAFDSTTVAAFDSLAIRMHSFYVVLSIPSGVNTKARFVNSDEAYNNLVDLSQKCDEISEDISQFEERLVKFMK